MALRSRQLLLVVLPAFVMAEILGTYFYLVLHAPRAKHGYSEATYRNHGEIGLLGVGGSAEEMASGFAAGHPRPGYRALERTNTSRRAAGPKPQTITPETAQLLTKVDKPGSTLNVKQLSVKGDWTDVTLNPVYQLRRERAERVCRGLKGGFVNRVVQHKDTHTAYCVTAKVGCTYWLSMMRWLHGDTAGRTFQNPLDIPRRLVHTTANLKHMKYLRFKEGHEPAVMSNRFRFMFVREPYKRLWSAYVDKFLLPDLWKVEGDKLLRHRSRVTQPGLAGRNHRAASYPDRGNKSTTRLCSNDVSFTDFLDYVSSGNSTKSNEHYRPYQYICSPCVYRPQLIGKMETFAEDSHWVLQRLNMTWVEGRVNSSEERAVHEMTMLIQDSFQQSDPKTTSYFKGCLNRNELAQRLWRAFQINGYLPRNVSLPLRSGQDVTQLQFQELALLAYKNRKVKSEHFWRQQKQEALTEAYREVPESVLTKVRAVFDVDFKLFGYDLYPDFVYGSKDKKPLETGT